VSTCSAEGATVLQQESHIMTLKTKRAEARDGCVKGGLCRRLDQFGSWHDYNDFVSSAREEQAVRATGLSGGMAADERPRAYLAKDEKSRFIYQKLGDFYSPCARDRFPHFADIP
jgi:hypothetical protein